MRRKRTPAPGRKSLEKSSKSPSSSKGARVSTPRKSANVSSAQSTSADVSRRTRRFKSGTKALKEIRALQRTTQLLIPKASFCRVVKETIALFSYESLRIQSAALAALQEAAEMYITQFFEDSLLCTLHAKRVTLMVQDCRLMRRLRGPTEVGNY